LALWLEQAVDTMGEGAGPSASALWKADRAAVSLRRAWRKQWQRQELDALMLNGGV
jgi:hypothetical protein